MAKKKFSQTRTELYPSEKYIIERTVRCVEIEKKERQKE